MLKKLFPSPNTSVRDNLIWIFRLRNVAIVAQLSLVLIFAYPLKIHLPVQELALIIIANISINLYTWWRLKTDELASDLEIFSQIILDVFSLASFIYLTGGASNPIIWVFLFPLILTAIMLPHIYAWNMVAITCCIYTILISYHIPLPAIEPHLPDPNLVSTELQLYLHNMQNNQHFSLHIFGMWLGFIFSAGLVAFTVVHLAETLKKKERSLAKARENALRDERIISMGALAASAAHDMGTPLGTMAILAGEIKLDYQGGQFADLNQKIGIIHQQINRCKDALSLLSISAGEMRATSGKAMEVGEYLQQVLHLWRTDNASAKIVFSCEQEADKARIIADLALSHAIITILQNAAQVSPASKGVIFDAYADGQFLHLQINDFGDGFPADIIALAGKQPVASNKQGLGVGLFLAYTTINRLGGKIKLSNNDSGASVAITLPLLANKDQWTKHQTSNCS